VPYNLKIGSQCHENHISSVKMSKMKFAQLCSCRWGYQIISKCQEPILQSYGAMSQMDRDLNCTTKRPKKNSHQHSKSVLQFLQRKWIALCFFLLVAWIMVRELIKNIGLNLFLWKNRHYFACYHCTPESDCNVQ
jgi:hypothetical protein